MQSLHRRIISAILAYAIILILLGGASDLATNEREARSGAIYTFVASNISQKDATVQWSASDGSPTSYAGKSMRWTAPVVDSPKDVIISLNLTNSNNCCKYYYKIFNLHVVPNPIAKISLAKDCLFSAPVKIGDHILYTYNVSNPGNLPLMDINLTDMQNWGPDCLPTYKSGDNGNGVLDPGETWRYECDYRVMDPSDYPILRIMQSNKGSTDLLRTIQRLMASKTRLEIIMDNLRHSASQFDMQAASLVKAELMQNGQIYTYYNYSNEVTGESFSKVFDQQGNLNETVYQDPTSGAVLTVYFSIYAKMLSEDLYYPPPETNEDLKIVYDLPAKGYNTITIVDYKSGDTLIL